MKKVCHFFTSDRLLLVSLLLALVSCLVGQFQLAYIDDTVILTLFALMLTIQGLEETGFLRWLAQKIIQLSPTTRHVVFSMTLLSFFSAMILTNDVAILTLLPLYLKVIQYLATFKGRVTGAVLIVIAANLGSSVLPFGNPQNLFLFSHYQLSFGKFLSWLLPVAVVSLVLLGLNAFVVEKRPVSETTKFARPAKKQTAFYMGVMLILILAVLHILPYYVTMLIGISAIVLSAPKLLKRVDYQLLLTFVCFFLVVGNLQEWQVISVLFHQLLKSQVAVFFGAVISSQVISNVPAAILLAPFTSQAQALTLGVNIGGLGTLLASLANLIGYKLVRNLAPDLRKSFFKQFTLYNLLYLAILILVGIGIIY